MQRVNEVAAEMARVKDREGMKDGEREREREKGRVLERERERERAGSSTVSEFP